MTLSPLLGESRLTWASVLDESIHLVLPLRGGTSVHHIPQITPRRRTSSRFPPVSPDSNGTYEEEESVDRVISCATGCGSYWVIGWQCQQISLLIQERRGECLFPVRGPNGGQPFNETSLRFHQRGRMPSTQLHTQCKRYRSRSCQISLDSVPVRWAITRKLPPPKVEGQAPRDQPQKAFLRYRLRSRMAAADHRHHLPRRKIPRTPTPQRRYPHRATHRATVDIPRLAFTVNIMACH